MTFFPILFFIIETILFLLLLIKNIKLTKKRNLTTAGRYFFAFNIFSLIFCVIGLISFYNDFFGSLNQLKSFFYLQAIAYFQIYFHKSLEKFDFENSASKARKFYSLHEKLKNSMYFYTTLIFILEVLCVPIYTNSKCYIILSELIPSICLLFSTIFQTMTLIRTKSENFYWLFYTLSSCLFLFMRFLIENIMLPEMFWLYLISLFFRGIQLYSLGYIIIKEKTIGVVK